MKGLVNVVILLVIVAVIAVNGIYELESGQEAVITRFGEFVRTETQPGLKWKIPVIEQRYVISVAEVRRMEFGFQTSTEGNTERVASYSDITDDALMLTADENLVNVETIIQYRITNTTDYLFNVDDQVGTLNVIAVSAIRRSVANNTLDDVLTDNKDSIQREIHADLQEIVNAYGLGIQITAVQFQEVYPPEEVDDAFQDIARAKLDKESKINEAASYSNRVLPEASGQAAQLISQAEGYYSDRINRAKGDVANFNQVYEKYVNAKQVTRTRMYLETMAEIMKDIEIIIMKENGDTLKFLPIQGSLTGGGN